MRDLLRRWRRTRVYRPASEFEGLPRELDWRRAEMNGRREERPVIRGLSRRVVVVRPKDPSVFEQALFIVREDAAKGGGEILREAQAVAERYVRGGMPEKRLRLRRVLPLLLSAAALAALIAIWLAVYYEKI